MSRSSSTTKTSELNRFSNHFAQYINTLQEVLELESNIHDLANDNFARFITRLLSVFKKASLIENKN